MSHASSSPPFYNVDLSPDASSTDTSLHYSFNSKFMVVAIIVLFFVIFFILMLHIYAKVFWFDSSPSIIISRRGGSTARLQPSINTGLDATLIAQLPTFIFKAQNSADMDSQAEKREPIEAPLLECAVCLSEFQENEKLRLLPSCKHTFHTECIDVWFLSHSTCPLCRTVVSSSTPKDNQHQGEERLLQEAMEASPNADGHTVHAPSSAVQFPCNVLFWGNEGQITSTQEPSTSNSTPSPASRARPRRPQITIGIPPTGGDIVVTISTPGRRPSTPTGAHSIDQAACSSQPLKSPVSLRASLKRMLSRQSSRHTAEVMNEVASGV